MKFGASLFLGAGETARSIDKLNKDNIHMTMEHNMGKDDKMNIRIDFALNGKEEETRGLYVDLLETF